MFCIVGFFLGANTSTNYTEYPILFTFTCYLLPNTYLNSHHYIKTKNIMEINMWAFPVAALIPLVIGSIWYNPKVFGAAWLKASGLTDEQARGGNMALIFGLSYVFALLSLSLSLVSQFYVFVISYPLLKKKMAWFCSVNWLKP